MLPAGFRVGHATIDDDGWATGCTVILPPPGVVAAGEVRGGGPGTRESDVLSPTTGAREVQAVLFSGGSAWGLGLADALMSRLWSDGRGYRTRLGHLIPLVPAAVVYDLGLGGEERPGTDAAFAAYDGATTDPDRGSVGAGTGCVVGKLLGAAAATKGGLGLATEVVDGAAVSALAVVNAFGDVLAEDGSVLAGPWRDGAYVRTVDLLRAGERGLEPPSSREATTLVCVMTDARLTKTDAWLLARAGSAGVARAVDPTATAVDGDVVYVLAAGDATPDPLTLAAVTPHVIAAAIRDAVRSATTLLGCPALGDPARGGPPAGG